MKTLKRLTAISTLVVLGLIQLMPSTFAVYNTYGSHQFIDTVFLSTYVDGFTDSNGNHHLVMLGDGDDNETPEIQIKYYMNSNIWGNEATLADYTGETPPFIASVRVDAIGNSAFVMWSVGDDKIYMRKHAGSWNSAVPVASDYGYFDFASFPDLQNLFVVYQDSSNNIEYVVGDDAGNFGAPETIASGTTQMTSFQVETSGNYVNGEVHVLAREATTGSSVGELTYYHATITEGSYSWDSPETVFNNLLYGDETVYYRGLDTDLDSSGNLHVVAASTNPAGKTDDHVYYAQRSSGGSWGSTETVASGQDLGGGMKPSVFKASDGIVYVGYAKLGVPNWSMNLKNDSDNWTAESTVENSGPMSNQNIFLSEKTNNQPPNDDNTLLYAFGGMTPPNTSFLKSFNLTPPQEGSSVPEFKTYMLILTLIIGMGLIYKAMPETVRNKT